MGNAPGEPLRLPLHEPLQQRAQPLRNGCSRGVDTHETPATSANAGSGGLVRLQRLDPLQPLQMIYRSHSRRTATPTQESPAAGP